MNCNFRFVLEEYTQKASGEWRLKTNEELEKAIKNENIVRYIKYK